MKIIKTRLETLTIVFGPKLHKFPRRVLGCDMPLLPPDLDPLLFARHYPPVFNQSGDKHMMVAHHLSYLILLLSEPEREVAIGLLDPEECTERDQEQLALIDQRLYASLAVESPARSFSQPTKTKAKYLAKGQICPLCFLDGRRVKLAAPQFWRRLRKEKVGGPLHCSRCALTVEVSAQELARFTNADLPTAGWLQVQRDGERPAACARCAARGRTGIMLIWTTPDGKQKRYCSNELQAEPFCTSQAPLGTRRKASTRPPPSTSSSSDQLPLSLS